MKYSRLILCVLLFSTLSVVGQEMVVARFSLEPGAVKRNGTPVSVSLDGIDFNTDKGALRLFEIKGKTRSEVSCQLEAGNSPRLWWIPEGESVPKVIRKFVLVKDSTFVAKKCDHNNLKFKGANP